MSKDEDKDYNTDGVHRQHDMAVGSGKKPTTVGLKPLGEFIADNEPDQLLPGYFRRRLERDPYFKKEYEEKIERRRKRDVALDAVMARTKVGADPLGINAIRRNNEIAELRGENFLTPKTRAALKIRTAPRLTRGYKRPRGRGYHTPKGAIDFGIERLVSRVPLRDIESERVLKSIATTIRILHEAGECGAKIGRLLIRAKRHLKRGEYLPWVKTVGLTPKTAERYIKNAIG
jgi:hypothetical protein